MNDKKFITVTGILLLVAILGFIYYMPAKFEAEPAVKISDFPKSIDGWTGYDVLISQHVFVLFETTNLLIRNYTDKHNNQVNLFMIYSQDNRKVAHPPELTIESESETITDKSVVSINYSIEATKMIIEKKDSQELVVYWYKVGDVMTKNYLKQQLKASIDRLFGKKTSICLIRLTTEINQNNQEEALQRIKSFSRLISPLLSKYAP